MLWVLYFPESAEDRTSQGIFGAENHKHLATLKENVSQSLQRFLNTDILPRCTLSIKTMPLLS